MKLRVILILIFVSSKNLPKEPEGWLGSREGGQTHEATMRTLGLWLAYLGKADRQNLFLIMTNRPDLIDGAIISAGRIDYVIPFLLPDVEQRESVLKVQFERIQKVPYKNLDFKDIATKTGDYNCAELENVVRESALSAFQRGSEYVMMEDVGNALMVVTIPRQKRDEEKKFYQALASKYCNVPQLMKGNKIEPNEIERIIKDSVSRW